MAEQFLISLIKSLAVVVWVDENKIKLATSIKIKMKKSKKINIKHEYSQSLCQELVHKLIWDVKNDHGHFHILNMQAADGSLFAWSWPVNQRLTGWNLSHISELSCPPMGTLTGSSVEQRRSGVPHSRVPRPLTIMKVTCMRISGAAFTGIPRMATNWQFIWLF